MIRIARNRTLRRLWIGASCVLLPAALYLLSGDPDSRWDVAGFQMTGRALSVALFSVVGIAVLAPAVDSMVDGEVLLCREGT